MLKTHMAACLVATALVAAPALAQTTAPAANPPGAGAMTSQNVNAAEFVNKAANSDLFEIQSSQLALNKTQDSRIREFAQHMVQDHTAASDKLKAAAQGQTVPTTLDQEHTQMLQQLQQASGNDFNRFYVQMQFDGHQKAVSLFESYAQNGDNAQLKQFAQQTVPTLQQHLQQITQIQNNMATPAQVGQAGSGQASQAFMTQMQPGHWRASDLEGLNVYNQNNESIGDISELIVDNSGKIQAVVVGVGGFLGIGERDVAIPLEQIRFVNEPRATATTATTGTTGATGTTAGTTGTTAPSGTVAAPTSPNALATAPAPTPTTAPATTGAAPAGQTAAGAAARTGPDHAVLTTNMTKDQLRAVPEFRYAR